MNLEKLKKFVENLSVPTMMLGDAIIFSGIICCVGLIFGTPGLAVLCTLAVYLFLYGD